MQAKVVCHLLAKCIKGRELALYFSIVFFLLAGITTRCLTLRQLWHLKQNNRIEGAWVQMLAHLSYHTLTYYIYTTEKSELLCVLSHCDFGLSALHS